MRGGDRHAPHESGSAAAVPHAALPDGGAGPAGEVRARADRARQLTQTLIADDFDGFNRPKKPHIKHFISMTHYADFLPTRCAFPPLVLHNTLGEVLSEHGLRQLRIAETEKYPHVTFFLNGGEENLFPNEERILIPSPKVATYDLQPEMSLALLTEKLITAIESKKFDLIVCNLANPDMVGHTGSFVAVTQALEFMDKKIGEIWQALKQANGEMLITADHGNVDCMFDTKTQQAHTAHTLAPVPFLYVGRSAKILMQEGNLADVAPSVLSIMGLPIPIEMTGKAIFKTD